MIHLYEIEYNHLDVPCVYAAHSADEAVAAYARDKIDDDPPMHVREIPDCDVVVYVDDQQHLIVQRAEDILVGITIAGCVLWGGHQR